MIVQNVRIDWVSLMETNKHGKYGATVIVPFDHPQYDAVIREFEKAKAKGIQNNLFTEAQTKSKSFKPGLRDGNEEIESEDRPQHYKDTKFMNAVSPDQPGLVDENLQPVLDRSKFYSGCYVNADINIAPFYNKDHNARGIGIYVNNVMFVKDGERLDGRQNAESAFAGLAPQDNLQ